MPPLDVIAPVLGFKPGLLLVPSLICLALVIGVVPSARRGRVEQQDLPRIGGMLLVVALIGLGFVLARSAG